MLISPAEARPVIFSRSEISERVERVENGVCITWGEMELPINADGAGRQPVKPPHRRPLSVSATQRNSPLNLQAV